MAGQYRRILKIIAAALLAALMLAQAAGCSSGTGGESSGTTAGSTNSDGTTGTQPGSQTEDTQTNPVHNPPKYTNPLTGLAWNRSLDGLRPAVISINNTTKAIPAVGVSGADVLIEVSAEGGETRLLMVTLDYANIPVIGSVRSARHYMIDFVRSFGGIFVHAGDNDLVKEALKQNPIDHIDGLIYDGINFYRDENRKKNMGFEHSLMITGEELAKLIAAKKFSTALPEGFTFPLQFVAYGETFVPSGAEAKNVVIPYSPGYRMQRLEYNPATHTYFRYHNISTPYTDGATGEQLQFTNVLILYFDSWRLGDTTLWDMTLTGTGDGYYIYGGKAMPIKWARESAGAQFQLTDKQGAPLTINRGKTYIAVARTDMYQATELNSDKGLS